MREQHVRRGRGSDQWMINLIIYRMVAIDGDVLLNVVGINIIIGIQNEVHQQQLRLYHRHMYTSD